MLISIIGDLTMGIFTRFKDIVNSNINALLDKAEDPEKLLRLMIQEMEDTLVELKASCAREMSEEIRVGEKIQEKEKEAKRWQERASLALEKDKEELAREALIEKKRASEEIDKASSSFKALSDSIEKSKDEIKTLEEKIAQAKEKLKTLKEREERIKREQKNNSSKLQDRFDEMEKRLNKMESESFKKRDEKEDKFRDLERDEEIENELRRMKEERSR